MGKQVWLVYAEAGEYSDYSYRPVRVFDNEDQAEEFRDECASEYNQACPDDFKLPPPEWEHPHDPGYGADRYRGEPRYSYTELPLNWRETCVGKGLPVSGSSIMCVCGRRFDSPRNWRGEDPGKLWRIPDHNLPGI